MKKINKRVNILKGAAAGIVLFLLISANTAVLAVPASPFPVEAAQSDGTIIKVYNKGDEYFNWSEDENGSVIAYDPESKNWCFAYINNEKILPNPDFAVGSETSKIDPNGFINGGGIGDLFKSSKNNFEDIKFKNETANSGISKAPEINGEKKIRQNQKILLFLIEFADIKLDDSTGARWYNSYFNTDAYVNSVANYYREVSGGKNIFIPANTSGISTGTRSNLTLPDFLDYYNNNIYGTPWVKNGNTSVTISQTGYNGVVKATFNKAHPIPQWGYDQNGDDNYNTSAMIAFALKAFRQLNPAFDFSGAFTGNANQDLHIVAVIAGGEASGGYSQTGQMWAHKWNFHADIIGQTSGSYHPSYMAHGEMYDINKNPLEIGVPCHELGHMLGLPDLYDITIDKDGRSASEGIGPYSLMSHGSWGSGNGAIPGSSPVHLDAWSKIELGYYTPVKINSGGYWEGAIESIAGNYSIIELTDAADKDQYFLLENRTADAGYDKGFFRFGIRASQNNNGGILIYHIDESMSGNADKNRRLVDVEEADGSRILEGYKVASNEYMFYNHFFSNNSYIKPGGTAGSTYGGGSGIFDRFDQNSDPNSDFYNAIPTNIKVKILSPRGTAMTVGIGEPFYGDLNGDGDIDVKDLVKLSRHVAEIEKIEGEEKLKAADVTGEGRVSIADVIRLARYIAGYDKTPLGKK